MLAFVLLFQPLAHAPHSPDKQNYSLALEHYSCYPNPEPMFTLFFSSGNPCFQLCSPNSVLISRPKSQTTPMKSPSLITLYISSVIGYYFYTWLYETCWSVATLSLSPGQHFAGQLLMMWTGIKRWAGPVWYPLRGIWTMKYKETRAVSRGDVERDSKRPAGQMQVTVMRNYEETQEALGAASGSKAVMS